MTEKRGGGVGGAEKKGGESNDRVTGTGEELGVRCFIHALRTLESCLPAKQWS